MNHYDAIVVGAGFAGLAAAASIKDGRVLLVDKKPIGTQQASACATRADLLETLGLQPSILQLHPTLHVHIQNTNYEYSFRRPYCTFDFKRLCDILLSQSLCQFVLATAYGFEHGKVITSKGTFTASYVVDASGWQAVLARCCEPGYSSRGDLTIGLETEVPFSDTGLHAWLSPHFPGYFWHFPCGQKTRFGMGTFVSFPDAKTQLERFMYTNFGLTPAAFHGGLIPSRLRKPIVGELFVVGDAAGQCFGFTGEGIRPALRFGHICGSLIQECLVGRISKEQAMQQYQQRVMKRSHLFVVSSILQKIYPLLPRPIIHSLAQLFGISHRFRRVEAEETW